MSVIAIFLLSPGGWAALAACATAIAAIPAFAVALSQLLEARRLRTERFQPYVVAYLAPIDARPKFIDLVIKNTGLTAATDIQVTFAKPLDSAALAKAGHSPIKLPEKIPVLVPGQEWRCFWDFLPERREAGLDLDNAATVSFKDWRRRTPFGPYTYDIDWQAQFDQSFIQIHGLHDVALELKAIRKLMREKNSHEMRRQRPRESSE